LLKILLVIYKLEVGGAERVVVSLAQGLTQLGHECLVCCFKGGPLEAALEHSGIRVINLSRRGWWDVSAFLKLVRLMKAERVSVVHTHSFTANLWGRLAGLCSGVPVLVTTEHTLATGKSVFQRVADKALAGVTDWIIAVSGAVKDSVVSTEGIPQERIITVYNGIAIDSPSISEEVRSGIRKALGIQDNQKVVVAVGRLEPPKGHYYLVKAAYIVCNLLRNVQFVIVGDGSLMNDLVRYVRELGLSDNVIFAGERSDVPAILQVCDLAVLSSVREGFSITLLEYMASGRCIIATDVGGAREALIHDESGLIVQPRNPMALAEAILQLLKDETAAKAMGQKAKERCFDRFTTARMVEDTARLYIQAHRKPALTVRGGTVESRSRAL